MTVNWVDIILWVLAFAVFLFACWALVDWVDSFELIPLLVMFACGVMCAALIIGGLWDANNRTADRNARRDFAAEGYQVVWVNRRNARMPVGSCLQTLDVVKKNGHYWPGHGDALRQDLPGDRVTGLADAHRLSRVAGQVLHA